MSKQWGPPHPKLRQETVEAWQKAGATFGYMREDDDHDGLWFKRDDFKADCKDLPALAIEWEDFVHCSRLPALEVPFALLLSPRDFDYTDKRPPPKKSPPGFTDVDVSNIFRVRYLRLSEGVGVGIRPMINGLQRLRQLETLELWVSTSSLKELKNSAPPPGLKKLAVFCQLTEENLRVIGDLKQITHLSDSQGANRTVSGLRFLTSLPKLQSLSLHACGNLTDSELAEAAKIPELRRLDISRCATVTSKGLNALAGAKKLEWLDIGEGPTTDGGWTEAGKMASLRWLRIGGPAVTDGALEQVEAIPGLRSLTLKACDQVTDGGYSRLGAHRRLVLDQAKAGRAFGADG